MNTHAKIDTLLYNLKQKNLQLYDKEEIQLKSWASKESNIIQGFLTSLHDLQTKIISDENNLSYVVKILQKRFGQTSVKDFDIARTCREIAETKRAENQRQEKEESFTCKKCKHFLGRDESLMG